MGSISIGRRGYKGYFCFSYNEYNMNWYKKVKISSNTLKLPPEIYPQIETIIKNILLFYKNFQSLPSSPIQIGTISFLDKYSNQNVSSNIYINNKFVEQAGNIPAQRDRITGNIYFNIYKEVNVFPERIDENYLKNILTNQLYHELSHSIDPKIISLQKQYPNMSDWSKPTEFDAYSRELIEYVKNAYQNPQNKESIKQWLVSESFGETNPEINTILNIPSPLFVIINFWKQNNPIYIKKLKQRIYNEVINQNIT
jgi:hypothetical protein